MHTCTNAHTTQHSTTVVVCMRIASQLNTAQHRPPSPSITDYRITCRHQHHHANSCVHQPTKRRCQGIHKARGMLRSRSAGSAMAGPLLFVQPRCPVCRRRVLADLGLAWMRSACRSGMAPPHPQLAQCGRLRPEPGNQLTLTNLLLRRLICHESALKAREGEGIGRDSTPGA
jgi:hypothetical protein